MTPGGAPGTSQAAGGTGRARCEKHAEPSGNVAPLQEHGDVEATFRERRGAPRRILDCRDATTGLPLMRVKAGSCRGQP